MNLLQFTEYLSFSKKIGALLLSFSAQPTQGHECIFFLKRIWSCVKYESFITFHILIF